METARLDIIPHGAELGKFETPQPVQQVSIQKPRVIVEPTEESGRESGLAVPKSETIWTEMTDPRLAFPMRVKGTKRLMDDRAARGLIR